VSDDASVWDRFASAGLVLYTVALVGAFSVDIVLAHAVVPIDGTEPAVVLVEMAVYALVGIALAPPRVRFGRLVGFWVTAFAALEVADRFLGPPAGLAGQPLLVLDAVLAVVAALALSAAFWYRVLPEEPLSRVRSEE
jgi:hypothetical protein